MVAEIVLAVRICHDQGKVHGSVATPAVRVGLSSGQVRLVDPEVEEEPEDCLLPATPGGPDRLRRADLHAVAAVVTELTDDVRTPAAERDPRRRALVTALDDLGAALTAAAHGEDDRRTPTRLAALFEVAGARGRHLGARAELAALAVTACGLESSGGRSPEYRTWPEAVSPVAPAPWVSDGAQRILARVSIVLASLAALGLVASLELTFLGDKLGDDLRRLTGSGEASASKVAQEAPGAVAGLPPLPVLGPGAAGSVTGIDLRAVGVCKSGSVCPMRIVVAVRPPRKALMVSWSIVVVDRCTGARTAGPSARLRVPGRAGTGSALTEVRLPRGAVAVIARTSTPARVASKAVPIPARPASC